MWVWKRIMDCWSQTNGISFQRDIFLVFWGSRGESVPESEYLQNAKQTFLPPEFVHYYSGQKVSSVICTLIGSQDKKILNLYIKIVRTEQTHNSKLVSKSGFPLLSTFLLLLLFLWHNRFTVILVQYSVRHSAISETQTFCCLWPVTRARR